MEWLVENFDYDHEKIGDLLSHAASVLKFSAANDYALISLLIARYGDAALSSQVFHYTSRPLFASLFSTTSQLGKEVLSKVALVFNLYIPDHNKDSQLLSNVLVDLVDNLCMLCQRFESLSQKSLQFSKNQLQQQTENEDHKDEQLSRELGFTSIVDSFMSKELFDLHIEESISACSLLATLLKTFLHCIESPTLLASLEKNIQDWSHTKFMLFQKPKIFAQYEQTRLAFLQHATTLLALVETFDKEVGLLLRAQQVSHRVDKGALLSAALQNSLSYTLQLAGHGLTSSTQAIQDLQNYCQRNKVAPTKILSTEFRTINPILDSVKTFFIPNEETTKATTATEQKLKKDIYMKTQTLQAKVEQLLLVSLTLLSGCGLKTNPKSNIPDLRPDIPFRETVPQKENETKSLNKTATEDESKLPQTGLEQQLQQLDDTEDKSHE
jgi:hypothetical protein